MHFAKPFPHLHLLLTKSKTLLDTVSGYSNNMMNTISLAAILIAVTIFTVAVEGKPWDPTPKTDQAWLDRHNRFVENSRNNSADIQIVFTGSSSIERWGSTGLSIWNEKYRPLGAVNYGIGGDSIENCLWRIVNGELDHINPKILIMYCGSNNIPGNPSNAEIVQGIMVTLNELARRLPNTKILYMNINPRGDMNPVETQFERAVAINEQIIALNNNPNRVIFDMFDELIESWGHIKEELFAGDKLHLNAAGYAVWDASWNSTLTDLWNGSK